MAVYQTFRLFCFLNLKKRKRFSKNFLGIQAFGVIAIGVIIIRVCFFLIDIESTTIKT